MNTSGTASTVDASSECFTPSSATRRKRRKFIRDSLDAHYPYLILQYLTWDPKTAERISKREVGSCLHNNIVKKTSEKKPFMGQ